MTLPSLFRRHRDAAVASPRDRHVLIDLHDDMNRVFEELWRGFGRQNVFGESWESFSPRVDVAETDAEVTVTAELPGLEDKDFELNVTDDALVLSGEKRLERDDPKHGWRERSYGRFERVVPLSCEVEVDKAAAEFKHGVLRVRLPKAPSAKPRATRVPVSTS